MKAKAFLRKAEANKEALREEIRQEIQEFELREDEYFEQLGEVVEQHPPFTPRHLRR